jgi:multicomponent K+:H+ antiporter subunit F
MMTILISICFVMIGIAAVLAIYRLLVGPTILDRIIGFDMAAICIVGMIILLSVLWKSPVYIEIMLIFSLLGFVGTVTFVSYFTSRPDRLGTPGKETPLIEEEKNHDP